MKIKWFSLIRVTALIFIVIYHFFPDTLLGGFIGVDIFFTLSGFLMTSLILEEIKQNNSFSIIKFFQKKFLRIFIPLVLMIIIILPLTELIDKDFTIDIDKQVASTLSFCTNFYEIINGGNYEDKFFPHLFIHTWTLAIEVHFYIFWGVILWIFSKVKLVKKYIKIIVFFYQYH